MIDKLLQLRWWQIVLIGFLLVMILTLLVNELVMPMYTRHGDEYELPDVTTRHISEARVKLLEAGFIPIIQDSTSDEDLAPGTVIQQNPFAYATVKQGRRVYLVVSTGEKMVEMPDLVTQTYTDAVNELAYVDLEVNYKHEVFADSVEHNGSSFRATKGMVIRQSIPPGDKVSRSADINLTVSLGEEPSSSKVPDLVGKSLDHALKELDFLEIEVGRLRYVVRKNLVPNTVVGQSIPAGAAVMQVYSIDLIISVDELPELEETAEDTLQDEETYDGF